jgi:hypothetical protein
MDFMLAQACFSIFLVEGNVPVACLAEYNTLLSWHLEGLG